MRLPALSRLGLATLACALPLSAMAQEAADTDDRGRTVVYASETVVDFEGLDVNGELVRPQGAHLQERRRAEFAPMIALRMDFNDELSASVDMIE
jgi:hypothetical protein